MRKVRELFGSSPDGKISTPAKVLGATFLTTVVVSSGLVLGQGGTSFPGGGGGGGGTANIWVGAAGSCADNAGLVSYDPATSCGTADAANDTCDNGDVIRVKSGTTIGTSSTGATSITGANGRTTACIVRAETNGSNITVTGALEFVAGASDITVYNPVWTNQTNTALDEYQLLKVETTGNDITVYNPDMSTIQLFGCGGNCTLEGGVDGGVGDIGPCLYDNPGPVCTPKISGVPTTSTGWTLKNLSIHDSNAVLPAVEDCGSDSCHTVGLAIFGGQNILIDGVSFWNNNTVNIRIQNCCGNEPANITIQNSRFAAARQYYDSLADTFGPYVSNAVDVDTTTAGMMVRFNSFYMRSSCPSASPCGVYISPNGETTSLTQYYGNIMSSPNCGTNGDLDHQNVFRAWNEFNSAQCGSSNSILAYTTNVPYASMPAWDGEGEPDFDIPNGTSWAGQDKVTSGCIPFDADGVARGSTCDAGAYEH